ncbi:major facilitator superfamily domain-containing protein [Coniella lustricola]|uniref:Major facilitator superfamily domain-containing protein n=1 Tax=Coniella lustricola TaxID=2025994 RepID=A0A2T2ZTI8_9PEZI|nr:major facilitator superfamily domain-containing protein [Coniella lustricola]
MEAPLAIPVETHTPDTIPTQTAATPPENQARHGEKQQPATNHDLELQNGGLRHQQDEQHSRGTATGTDTDGSGEDGDIAQTESDQKKKPQLQDQTNLLPTKELIIVMFGLSCALFCSLLDQTIVSTALPTLGREFHDASISSWVGTAYLLTSTACQPLYGRLSDVFGRKAVLLGSMGFFLFGSILCAVAQSMVMLIIFRAVSGIGGGGILTSVMITTSDVVSLEKRGTYQGLLGVVVAGANSIGPLVGGVFSESVSWRWCFYINIPLTSIAILVVAFVLPLKKPTGSAMEKLKKIDYLGCVTMLASALLVLLPLSWGGTAYPWNSAGFIAPLMVGIGLFGAFIFIECRVAGLPLIPLHIFKISTVAGAYIGAFFTGFMFYCNLYYLPQFYQVVRGASPIRSGILLLPLTLVQTVTSFTAGFLVSKTGNYQLNLWIGFGIWTVACGLLSTISPSISDAKLIGYQILSGIGAGQTFQTSLVAIQASVARADMAVATGTRNFLRLLGGTVALAACAAILNNTAKADLQGIVSSTTISEIISDPTQISAGTLGLTAAHTSAAIMAYSKSHRPNEVLLGSSHSPHGIRNIYYFMIPCCAISFFVTLCLVKGHSLRREDDARLQEEGKKWAANRQGILHRKNKAPDDGTSTDKARQQEERKEGEGTTQGGSMGTEKDKDRGVGGDGLAVTPLKGDGDEEKQVK